MVAALTQMPAAPQIAETIKYFRALVLVGIGTGFFWSVFFDILATDQPAPPQTSPSTHPRAKIRLNP